MNKTTLIMKKTFLFLSILTVISSYSQDEPFYCDYNAYLFQYNDVYSVDLASGSSYLMATDITEGNINAAGYNPTDGYIWGSLTSPQRSIVRIGKDYSTTTYYVPELPTSNRYVGDISANGVYYLKGGGTTYYKIDINPDSPTYEQHLATETLSQNINIHDWAFNALDGNLYTVEKNSNKLYRINAADSSVENLGEVPILSGLNYTYGAVYFDASGRFYVSANQTGTIYIIYDVKDLSINTSMNSNVFAFGPSSASNDGARCPTAPVPQEDCMNGIDDDGDGLVDCEDPSCSGVASCPVIEVPTSGGNDGGLESNDRLSQQINKRNFNRVKTNYAFDKRAAARVNKTVNYGVKNRNSELQLQDFIPLNVISEDEIIESTPADLINITNATDVYAVDYLSNTTTVASILALKTENGVYEHTKYICDRLLGAELISVSTIQLNEQEFIKSIIKNTDGSMEFVLSLSAKTVNNDANFAVESHWNLDRYESNTDFYNFQIWSNSLDDLLVLGEELLRLLTIQRPIDSYNNSTPPTVFVRKGKYINGKLDLQIINTNNTQNVDFDAGYKETETSDLGQLQSTIQLNDNYISNVEIETGNLFDIGFRIGDGIATPDDLFMSDGPWGVDDYATSTTITTFDVLPNEEDFEENEFPIERNVLLRATTSEYVSVYRALTPRFKAFDLSDYNTFKFRGEGTGIMEVRLIKESIESWEEQFVTTVTLTENMNEFSIPFTQFASAAQSELVLDDIVTIVFTMISQNGITEDKYINIEQVRFSEESSVLGTEDYLNDQLNINIKPVPNPMTSYTILNFDTNSTNRNANLQIIDRLGRIVVSEQMDIIQGENNYRLERSGLKSGMYICKINCGRGEIKIGKLLIK